MCTGPLTTDKHDAATRACTEPSAPTVDVLGTLPRRIAQLKRVQSEALTAVTNALRQVHVLVQDIAELKERLPQVPTADNQPCKSEVGPAPRTATAQGIKSGQRAVRSKKAEVHNLIVRLLFSTIEG
jgi:hypothetical protein